MNLELTIEDYPSDPDLYIPFSLVTRDFISYKATCVSDSEKIVKNYFKIYNECLFSKEAENYLIYNLNKIYNPMGYYLPDNLLESDVVYKLSEKPDCSDTNIIKFSSKYVNYENLTDIDLQEAVVAHQNAYIILNEGKIVSVSCENFTENNETEIACETALDFRNRGYAYAVSSALCNEIISSGKSVLWRCNKNNIPSVKSAEKLGFIKDGRELYACYYLGEEE